MRRFLQEYFIPTLLLRLSFQFVSSFIRLIKRLIWNSTRLEHNAQTEIMRTEFDNARWLHVRSQNLHKKIQCKKKSTDQNSKAGFIYHLDTMKWLYISFDIYITSSWGTYLRSFFHWQYFRANSYIHEVFWCGLA